MVCQGSLYTADLREPRRAPPGRHSVMRAREARVESSPTAGRGRCGKTNVRRSRPVTKPVTNSTGQTACGVAAPGHMRPRERHHPAYTREHRCRSRVADGLGFRKSPPAGLAAASGLHLLEDERGTVAAGQAPVACRIVTNGAVDRRALNRVALVVASPAVSEAAHEFDNVLASDELRARLASCGELLLQIAELSNTVSEPDGRGRSNQRRREARYVAHPRGVPRGTLSNRGPIRTE